MNYLFLASLLLAVAPAARAQTDLDATSRQILREGLALYELERASWVSTDLLQASPFPLRSVTGYFSYTTADSVRTLFVGGTEAAPLVLAEYRYHRSAIRPEAAFRYGRRPLQSAELGLLQLRRRSMADLQHIPGIGRPAQASFNAVLLPTGRQTRVYVLTGSTQPGALLLGNDYLLQYSATGRLLTSRKLHPDVINLGQPSTGAARRATQHAHQPDSSPFITPTDICTLLLYRDRLPDKTHLVFSRKYVSVFSLADARLTILSRQAFNKLPKP